MGALIGAVVKDGADSASTPTMALIRQAPPAAPDQDGKRGRFSWALGQDRGEIGY